MISRHRGATAADRLGLSRTNTVCFHRILNVAVAELNWNTIAWILTKVAHGHYV
jgi:hypothetical protein